MRPLFALLLIANLTVPTYAGGRRRSATTSPAVRDAITISFVGVGGSASDAVVDAGPTSQQITRHRFGIRLDGPAEGVAMLRAYLETDDGRSRIRIDGLQLGTTPRVIHANAPIGRTAMHTLEIEVPPTVDAGAFASAIRWDVTTETP